MTRPIKFRSWDSTNKKMSNGMDTLVRGDGEVFIQTDVGEGASAGMMDDNLGLLVMQFTGLLDRNEKEVYEGDFISIDGWELNWVVRWVVLEAAFQPCMASTGAPMRRFNWLDQGVNGIYMQMTKTTDLFEVIGNIHENPELLK